MQNISNICERIGLNLLPSQQFPPSFISASIKGNASISTLVPSLNNYGYYLHPSNLIEPISPGGSSPCYSNHNENDPPCIEREHEYSLHEMGRMFMDSLAVGDTALPPDTANSTWLLIHGLHEKHYIDEFLTLMRQALNLKFKDIRIVNYKGKQSTLLEFFDVYATQMTFMCLKNDPSLKAFLHLDWHILTLYIKSQEFSQLPPFNGVVVANLPVACTVNTIKGLIQAHCPGAISIHVEMPVVIGEENCTLIRTPSLEDAELICIGLNALPTRTGQLKAALHPDCEIRHTDPSKDPFYELKTSHRAFPFHNQMMFPPPPDPRFQFHPPYPQHPQHHPQYPYQYHQSYQEEASFVRKSVSERRGGNYGPPRDDSHWQRREQPHHHNIPHGLSHKETGRILQHENFKRDSGRFLQHENHKRDYRSDKPTASRYPKSPRYSRMQEPYDPDNQESKSRYMQATYNKLHKNNPRAPYNPYLNPNPDEKVVYPEIEAQEVADHFKPAKERNKPHDAEEKNHNPRDSILIREEPVNFRREQTAHGIFKYGEGNEDDLNKNDGQWSDLWNKTWHHKPEHPQKQQPSEAPPINDLLDQHSQYHSQSANLQDNIQKVSEMVTPSGKYTVVTQIFKCEEDLLPEKVKSQLPYQRSNSVQQQSQTSKNSAVGEEELSGQSFFRRSHSDTYKEYSSSKFHSLDFIPPHHSVLMGNRKISMELERSNSLQHNKNALKKQTSFLTSPSVGQYHSDEDEQDPNISIVMREVNSDHFGSDDEMKNWKPMNFEIFIDAGSLIQEEPQVKLESYVIPKNSKKSKTSVLTQPLIKKEFFNTTPKQPELFKATPHVIQPLVLKEPLQVQKSIPGNQGFLPFNDRLIFSTKPDTVIPVQTKLPPTQANVTATLPLQDTIPLSQKNTQNTQIKDPRLKFQVKQEEQHKPETTPKPTMEIEQNKPALEKDPRLKFKVKQLEEETKPKPTMEIEPKKPTFEKISVKEEPVIEPPPPKLLPEIAIKPKLDFTQEPATEPPTKPLVMVKQEVSQESTTTEPSPKLLSGVVLMPRLELNKETSTESHKKKRSRFTDKIEEFKSEGPKSPNVGTMQVEPTVVNSIESPAPVKKRPSRFTTSLSSDSVSTEATQPLTGSENQTKMIDEPQKLTETPKAINSLPPAVETKQEPSLGVTGSVQDSDPDDAFQKLNSLLFNFTKNQSSPAEVSIVDKENSIPANPDKGNSLLMPSPSLSTRKESENFNSAQAQETLQMNPPTLQKSGSGRKSLDEIYRQFCEEEGIEECEAEVQISTSEIQPEETPTTPQNTIEEIPRPATEETQSVPPSELADQVQKEEPAVPIKVALRKSKFSSIPSPPRVRTLIHEKEAPQVKISHEDSEKASSQETSSPTNRFDSDKKQPTQESRFIPGSIFIERKGKRFQNFSLKFVSGKKENVFTQKQDDQVISLNQKRSRDELLPAPTPSKRTLPKGYTWKRTKTPQAFLPPIDNSALLFLSQTLLGQPQDPVMRPALPQDSIQNLLFPEIPTFLSYSHSQPAFYDPEKPSGEIASSDLQIQEIPQTKNQPMLTPAFYDPGKSIGQIDLQIEETPQSHDQMKSTHASCGLEKPGGEFSLGDFKIHETTSFNDQAKLNSVHSEPEKPSVNLSSGEQQIQQSDDQKKLMAEYWDFKKALELEGRDEDQMSVEPEGTPPMLPEETEEGLPEGTPPMIPEEGSPEGTPPMLPEEVEEGLPEGTPPMLPQGSPEFDDEAIGEDEDPQPTKKVIRDGVDFHALEIHHRENSKGMMKLFEYLS